MTLPELIRSRKTAIVERWAALTRDVLKAEDAEPRLRNDLPVVLDQLAEYVEDPQNRPVAASAGAHGAQRHATDFSIAHLVREYGLVLEAVMEAVESSGGRVAPDEVRRFSRALFEAQSQSVEAYAKLRDRELEERAAEHRSFIGHEIRTPLTAARFAFEVLERTSEPSAARDRLGRSLERLKQTVDDALTEAQLAADRGRRKQRLALAGVVQDALEDVRLAAERRGLRLETVVPEGLHVHADRRLLHSILTNLLGNAVKFSHPESTVRVRGRRIDARRVRLEVEDGCGGLAPGDEDRIFGRFVQAGQDRSGFGVGLAIVRQAVEVHGGDVGVENRPGSGCVMRVDLPVVAEGAPAAASAGLPLAAD